MGKSKQKYSYWEECSNGWQCAKCSYTCSDAYLVCPSCGCKMTNGYVEVIDKTPSASPRNKHLLLSDRICPLLKSRCIREKCVCFSMRDTDPIGFGFSTAPYGTCSYFKLNLDYEDDAVMENDYENRD